MTAKTITAAVLALGVAAFGAAASHAADKPLMAMMDGAHEKPTAGDAKGAGMATVHTDAQGQLCYDLTVKNLADATMAHIHKAAPDAAGPVAVPLTAPDATGKSSGCAKVDPAVVKDIMANPGGYYVNVHSKAFPGGAIRGQLGK